MRDAGVTDAGVVRSYDGAYCIGRAFFGYYRTVGPKVRNVAHQIRLLVFLRSDAHRDDEDHSAARGRAARGDVPVLPAVALRGVLRVAGREHDRPAAGRGGDRTAARAEGDAGEVLSGRGTSPSDDGRTRGRGGGDDARGGRGAGGDVRVCR